MLGKTNGENENRNIPSLSTPPLSAPLQDELDALQREKLDLHSQLFEAGQIQRKLSGARELHHGCLQFASEVFAARFLSGDFTDPVPGHEASGAGSD